MENSTNACDRECGNCTNFTERMTPKETKLGRDTGLCAKLNQMRFETDYCWRWEQADDIEKAADRHISVDGRGSTA